MAKRIVFIDPDGTSTSNFGVVIEYSSGVLYTSQCGGVATIERSTEGYYVPLSHVAIDPDLRLDPIQLREPFHRGRSCAYGRPPSHSPTPKYSQLPHDRLNQLIRVIATIPWWSEGGVTDSTKRRPLLLDETRLAEILEGWVPVSTADGPGVLIWPNCD